MVCQQLPIMAPHLGTGLAIQKCMETKQPNFNVPQIDGLILPKMHQKPNPHPTELKFIMPLLFASSHHLQSHT